MNTGNSTEHSVHRTKWPSGSRLWAGGPDRWSPSIFSGPGVAYGAPGPEGLPSDSLRGVAARPEAARGLGPGKGAGRTRGLRAVQAWLAATAFTTAVALSLARASLARSPETPPNPPVRSRGRRYHLQPSLRPPSHPQAARSAWDEEAALEERTCAVRTPAGSSARAGRGLTRPQLGRGQIICPPASGRTS